VTRRLLLIGAVALVLLTCIVWFSSASIIWSTRGIIVGLGSPQAAASARFAVVVYAATGVNVIALLVFLIRRHGWGWWLLAAAQVGDFIFSLVEGIVRTPTWWPLSGLAALTLVLLYLLRKPMKPTLREAAEPDHRQTR
jgi:hypothetical protein